VTAELPEGFGLALDPRLRRFREGTVLAGGRPGRVLTLSPAGTSALDALVAGDLPDHATRLLAGRLVRAGMAHPRRPRGDGPGVSPPPSPSVTVVVPARDRVDALGRCLASLGTGQPVLVVDDASTDPGAVADTCRAFDARTVRREVNGGPGAARTTAVALVDTELIAFVDSDCTVPEGWLDDLIWRFADPTVGAVAPRVRPARPVGTGDAVLDRFARAHGPLDLGPDEGEVGPDRAVRYVPTAALVVRRTALDAVGGFAPGMRVGEDVDLVWRLVGSGWSVRYVPSVSVAHDEPERWKGVLARRFTYGTSAAPLARRHPGRLAPVELRPRPLLGSLALLAGRPALAAAVVATSAVPLARTVRPLGIPAGQAWRWSAGGTGWTLVGLGRAVTMLAWPGLLALAATGRRGRRAAAVLLAVPPTVDWVRRRPELDLPRWVVASVADDIAYGAGVWTGCLREHTLGPLLPTLRGDHQS
jgi:mycofactocin system glycosyltransferase